MVSPAANPLSELLIPKEAVIDEYEVCPSAGVTIERMCGVIQTHGGSSLVVDYGKDGPSRNSLRVRIIFSFCQMSPAVLPICFFIHMRRYPFDSI